MTSEAEWGGGGVGEGRQREVTGIFSIGVQTQSPKQRALWVQQQSSKHRHVVLSGLVLPVWLGHLHREDRHALWCFHLHGVFGMGEERPFLGILSLEFLKCHEVSRYELAFQGWVRFFSRLVIGKQENSNPHDTLITGMGGVAVEVAGHHNFLNVSWYKSCQGRMGEPPGR